MLHHPSVSDTSQLSYSGSILRRHAPWRSAIPRPFHNPFTSRITLHVSCELGSLTISDFCSPSSISYFQSYFTSWSVLYFFLLPKRRLSYTFFKICPRNALRVSHFADRRPTNTYNTFEQHPGLEFNQNNGSIHLQRNRSERKRLQGFVLYDCSHAENTRKSLTSGSSTKLTKVAATLSSIHGYSSHRSWFLEPRTQWRSGRR